MSRTEASGSKIDIINSIKNTDIKIPDKPVETFIREAEILCEWCDENRDVMDRAGIDMNIVEDIPDRVSALRKAEDDWISEIFPGAADRKKWKNRLAEGHEIKKVILHVMTYVFRNDPDLMGEVVRLKGNDSDDDLMQNLKDISDLGKSNSELLTGFNFDLTLLKNADKISKDMTSLQEKSADENKTSQSKIFRDKAYTHLQEAVDLIHEYSHMHGNPPGK